MIIFATTFFNTVISRECVYHWQNDVFFPVDRNSSKYLGSPPFILIGFIFLMINQAIYENHRLFARKLHSSIFIIQQ